MLVKTKPEPVGTRRRRPLLTRILRRLLFTPGFALLLAGVPASEAPTPVPAPAIAAAA
jgi:hypothetical protein